jgi:hypothetical protein
MSEKLHKANEVQSKRAMNRVAIEAFFNIMQNWKIEGVANKRKLLGMPSESLFFKWQRSEVGSVPHDTLIRISYLMGIHKALKMLFSGNNERSYAWIKKPNNAFGGRSAYDRMLAGEVTDLAFIRQYLDSMRGM